MTLDERVAAAAEASAGTEWAAKDFTETLAGDDPADMRAYHLELAAVVLSAAFPELFDGKHKIVPLEPTETMLRACHLIGTAADDYRAMIDAAP